jgi:hypothetical protein
MDNNYKTFKEVAKHLKTTIREKMDGRVHTGTKNKTLPTDKAGVTIIQQIADNTMDTLYDNGEIPVRLTVLARTDQTIQEDINRQDYGIVNLSEEKTNRLGPVNLLFPREEIQAYRDEKYDSIDMDSITKGEPKGSTDIDRESKFDVIEGGQDNPQNFNYRDKSLEQIK